MVILATVQGNIGSGKSTLIQYLRDMYKDGDKKVCFLQEPVDEWNTIKDSSGTTMLELFYGDQGRYAFGFQMMAYISRLVILKRAIEEGYDVIISERSLDTDRNIFAKMLYDDGKISDVEYQIYMKWFDEFKKDFPVELIIYVKTSPEVAHLRVGVRGRKGEDIPIEYLQKCHDYHEQWISEIPSNLVCELDGNIDINKMPLTFNQWKININTFIASVVPSDEGNVDDVETYSLYFDGGSRGNPGPGGCGYCILKGNEVIFEGKNGLGVCTNNYAEYKGLQCGIELAIKKKIKRLNVFGDSLLVINQMTRKWECRHETLRVIFDDVSVMLKTFVKITFNHVPRTKNSIADSLANDAMDEQDINK